MGRCWFWQSGLRDEWLTPPGVLYDSGFYDSTCLQVYEKYDKSVQTSAYTLHCQPLTFKCCNTTIDCKWAQLVTIPKQSKRCEIEKNHVMKD